MKTGLMPLPGHAAMIDEHPDKPGPGDGTGVGCRDRPDK